MAKEVQVEYYKVVASIEEEHQRVVAFYCDLKNDTVVLFDMVRGGSGISFKENLTFESDNLQIQIDLEEYRALLETYSKIEDSKGKDILIIDEWNETRKAKTKYTLISGDFKIVGYTHRNVEELIPFLLEAKHNENPLVVADENLKIKAMISVETLKVANFIFKKL